MADISVAQDRSDCILRIKSISLPYIVLGNPIFVDYYTIHDTENGKMGIAPNSLSAKRDIESVKQDSLSLQFIQSHAVYQILSISAAAVVAVLTMFAF